MKLDEVVDNVKKVVRTRGVKVTEDSLPVKCFNTGSVLLNLACSDNVYGGYGIGKMVNLIGDSSSGKTLLALSAFAEMVQNSWFNDYACVYDDVEASLEFDLVKMFGKKTSERIISPQNALKCNEEVIKREGTIQEFQTDIFSKLSEDSPFLWVLDSLDALTAKEEIDRVEKEIKLREKGKESDKGSYRMEKPKVISEILRQIIRRLNRSKSGLIIISQTRDNINPLSFETKTRSGGRALRFYCTHEIWLTIKEKILSKNRVVGVKVKAKVTKNKLTGKLRNVEFPIYYDYGVDNVGSCIDFLVEEKYWNQKGNTIIAESLELEGTRQKLIKQIEENCMENKLFLETEKAWLEIEESLKLNRKPKYT